MRDVVPFRTLRGRLTLVTALTTLPAFLFVIYVAAKERGEALRRAETEARYLATLTSREHAHQVAGARRMLEHLASAGAGVDIRALLPAILAASPQVANLWIVGRDGSIAFSVVSPPRAFTARDNPLIAAAQRSGAVVTGEYQIGPIVGRPVLLMARTLGNGETLVAALELSWLDRLARQSGLPQQTKLVIADRSGRILAGGRGRVGGFEELAATPGEMRAAHIEGVRRLAAAVPLDGAPDIWAVAGPPERDVYAAANRIFYRDVAVLALLTLFAVGASLIATDLSVLRDLRLLASAARRFGKGELGARAPEPAARGEIRELTAAFNAMAAALEQRQQRLRALSNRLTAAREDEAARIAQELHDHLGQELTVMKFEVESLRRTADAAAVDALSSRIDDAVQSVRRISSQLRPGVLDRLGLAAGLEWLLREFERHTKITTDLVVEGDTAGVDREVGTALFRIAQEALTNVARHAQASLVEVRLRRAAGNVELRLHDDGRGFDPAAIGRQQPSLGLLGIEERAHRLHGSARVESSPGAGTTLMIVIPEGHANSAR